MPHKSITRSTDVTEQPGPFTGEIPALLFDRASVPGGYIHAEQSHYDKLCKLAHRENAYIAYYLWEDEKGDKEDRKLYQQALALAKEGKYKILVIAEPARFSRGGHERIRKFELLEKYGVRILRGDDETYDVPGERRYVEAYQDNDFLRKQAIKAIDNLPYAVKSGKMPGHMPTGLKRELRLNEDKTAVEAVIVHHPIYGPLVQKMARDYISGIPVRRIVAELNAGTAPNPNNKDTGLWTTKTVYSIFHCYANLGVIKWGRTHRARHIPYSGEVITVDNAFEPLLDEPTWAQLHARLSNEKSHRNVTRQGYPAQLLDGTLRCSSCGGNMYVTSTTSNGHRYYSYVCAATRRGLAKCDNPSISHRVADQAVINEILRLERKPWQSEAFDAAVQSDPHEPLRIKLRAEIAQAESDMKAHARKVMSMGDMPPEMLEAMREIADEIALRIRHLKDQLASVPKKTVDPVAARTLYERMAQDDIVAYVMEAQAKGATDVLKDIVAELVESATIVERTSGNGTSKRSTWARAQVKWMPHVELLLSAGILTVNPVMATQPAGDTRMSTAERIRRYRERKAQQKG
jgi:Recombinase zinc beta ribbon domain/Recombinase/Resolvase, N terminal domain